MPNYLSHVRATPEDLRDSGIRCSVCGIRPPFNPNIPNSLTMTLGADDLKGWGLFVKDRDNIGQGCASYIDNHLCPGHSNAIAVYIPYLKSLRENPRKGMDDAPA